MTAVLRPTQTAVQKTLLQRKYRDAIPAFKGSAQSEGQRFYDKDYETFRYVFNWLETPTAHCDSLRFHPDQGGMPVCESAAHPTSGPGCLVYSFGLDHDLPFERSLAGGGCEVHAFDPQAPNATLLLASGVSYYRAALHRLDGVELEGRKLHTLDGVMDNLKHSERIVSYVKVDINYDETYMFMQQLHDNEEGRFVLDHVNQIGINIHLSKDIERFFGLLSFVVYEASFKVLHEAGFRLVYTAPFGEQTYLFPGVEHPVYLGYRLLLVRSGRDVWDRRERGNSKLRRAFVYTG